MKDGDADNASGTLIPEMLAQRERQPTPSADLVIEPEVGPAADAFSVELEKTLNETQHEVVQLTAAEADPSGENSWTVARSTVERFQPVPWFIWRLTNFVLGRPGTINRVSDGLVLGLRRLLFAAASDSTLGIGEKVNDVRRALQVLPSDVVAATAVIHAVCRRLGSRQFERIWRPILEDALVRAQIGHAVGSHVQGFGAGRGMLAGFAGRAGLVIQIASGELEQARRALELLATGVEIRDVGLRLYSCEPLQVSAMTLSAAGVGRDAAIGTASYASGLTGGGRHVAEQKRWLATFTVIEHLRMGTVSRVEEEHWMMLGFQDDSSRDEIMAVAKRAIRRGHGWGWIL